MCRHDLFRRLFASFVVVLFLPALPQWSTSALAQHQVRSERINFQPGRSGRSVRGAIRGYEVVDYVIAVSARQRMAVELKTNNASNYFNVTAPGASAAMHIGSSSGNRFTTVIPSSGDYRIRVYLMRNAARRGARANYTLSVDVIGNAGGVRPPDFADGLEGGPDFWRVANVPPGDRLNIRTQPSASSRIVARVGNGAVLRNMGCRMNGQTRWCRIEMRNGAARGWAAGRYLRE